MRAKSRVIQATDPALRQAVDQVAGGNPDHRHGCCRRDPTFGGLVWHFYAALERRDLKEARRALQGRSRGPTLALSGFAAHRYCAGSARLCQGTDRLAGGNQALAGPTLFVIRQAQALQALGKDKGNRALLQEQTKRWMGSEPVLFQMLAKSQERVGETVVARQTMATYYAMMGMLPAALAQLTQARTLTQDFYVQSQLDVEIRALRARIAEDRQLLERFKS